MQDPENACKDLEIPLFVLPPAKPRYNGKVERSNRVFREEFYADLSETPILGVRRKLMKFLQKYKAYRSNSARLYLQVPF